MKGKMNDLHSVLIGLLTLVITGISLPGARAQGPNHVGLVVLFGDGSYITRCVEFSEPEISGYDVLVRSGLNVVAAFDAGEGGAICAIDGEGCPADNCFCQCQGNLCVYWAYYHMASGQWQYSSLGASNYKVHSGDVEGWAWAEGSIGGGGAQPPVIPFDQVCVSSPPPTDTPASPAATLPPPTETPVPAPTTTLPPPTETPLPVPTITAPPPTPVVWFRLDNNPIPVGDCTMVRWDTTDALDVYVDGEWVNLSGGREVCPTTSQEYHLRVVGRAGEQTYTLVLGVTGASPSPTLSPQPTAPLSPSFPSTPEPVTATSPPPSPTPQFAAALSLSLSPTLQPSATPHLSPSPTPVRLAFAPLSPAPTRTTRPARASPLSSSTVPPANGDHPSSLSLLLGYITFNFILIGLLSWLILRLLRRR